MQQILIYITAAMWVSPQQVHNPKKMCIIKLCPVQELLCLLQKADMKDITCLCLAFIHHSQKTNKQITAKTTATTSTAKWNKHNHKNQITKALVKTSSLLCERNDLPKKHYNNNNNYQTIINYQSKFEWFFNWLIQEKN